MSHTPKYILDDSQTEILAHFPQQRFIFTLPYMEHTSSFSRRTEEVRVKKNSALCTENVSRWPTAVVDAFHTRLVDENLTLSGERKPYWKEAPISGEEMPPALVTSPCYVPVGCAFIT
jgi:hypothetical protein